MKIKSNYPSISKFNFTEVTRDQVADEIMRLDASKSSSGSIPISVIKTYSTIIVPQLTSCINKAINAGYFPDILKTGDITPIFKKDDKTDKSNFRPISILSPFSKIFERLICNQLLSHMNDKLSKYLCAYSRGCNTEDALLRLLENWKEHLDNKQIVGTVLCDLSKAFGTLPFDLIVAKLEAYGLDHKALNQMYSYLSCRKQRVK